MTVRVPRSISSRWDAPGPRRERSIRIARTAASTFSRSGTMPSRRPQPVELVADSRERVRVGAEQGLVPDDVEVARGVEHARQGDEGAVAGLEEVRQREAGRVGAGERREVGLREDPARRRGEEADRVGDREGVRRVAERRGAARAGERLHHHREHLLAREEEVEDRRQLVLVHAARERHREGGPPAERRDAVEERSLHRREVGAPAQGRVGLRPHAVELERDHDAARAELAEQRVVPREAKPVGRDGEEADLRPAALVDDREEVRVGRRLAARQREHVEAALGADEAVEDPADLGDRELRDVRVRDEADGQRRSQRPVISRIGTQVCCSCAGQSPQEFGALADARRPRARAASCRASRTRASGGSTRGPRRRAPP